MRVFYVETMEMQFECDSPMIVWSPVKPEPGDILQYGGCMHEVVRATEVQDLNQLTNIIITLREESLGAEMCKLSHRKITGNRQNIIDAIEESDKVYYETVNVETTIVNENVDAMEFIYA